MFKRSEDLGNRLMVHEYNGRGGYRLARGLVYVNFESIEDLCHRMTFVEVEVPGCDATIDVLIISDGLSCVSFTYEQHDIICAFAYGAL